MLPAGICAGGVNTTTLTDNESFNFATQTSGTDSGGDLYYCSQSSGCGAGAGAANMFWANNIPQQGLQDVGSIPLLSIASIPATGYYTQGVPAVIGHSYISLANTGDPAGEYIFFQVTAVTANSVTINWIYGSTAPANSGISPAPAPPSLLLGAIGLAGCGLFLAYRRIARTAA
jgi:hypothetical protein